MKRLLLLLSTIPCLLSAQAQSTIDFSAVDPHVLAEHEELIRTVSNGSCAAFSATPSSTPVSCNGFSDGAACITVTSGVGPFTYLWLGESSVDSCLTNVDAGSYIVIVTDVGQATSCSWQITVGEPTAIGVIQMNAIPPSCAGVCDGQANPLVVGGNGGFMFDYDSGETTQMATMLCNPFQLTITDSQGCISDTLFEFANAPDTIIVDAVITDNSCFGIDDGAVDISISGGVGTFDHLWTGPGAFSATTEDISALAPGDYLLTVTDDNGCSEDTLFTVEEAQEIFVDAMVVDVLCFADSTGSIDITVTGGVASYDFNWTGPGGFTSTQEDLSLIAAGDYFLTITDASGCDKDTSFTVLENPEMTMSGIVTDNLCFQDSTGAIDVTVVSVSGVDTYAWTGPDGFTSASEDIMDLVAGTYTLTVTDLLGCEKDTTYIVEEPLDLDIAVIRTDILCNGDSTGAIDITVSGGMPIYDFSWTGPDGFTSVSEDLVDLLAGDYMLLVTDMNSCAKDTIITILEADPILVDDTITNTFCASEATGAIEIDISGGQVPYDTQWNGPGSFTSSDEDIFGLEAGTYGLIVTDANSCEADFSYEVVEPDTILIDFMVTDLGCAGDSSGAIDITVTGGVGTYDYVWVGPAPFGATTEDISGLAAGIYGVQVTDENDCTSEAFIEVAEPDAIQLDTVVTHITCPEDDDGSIDLSISGGGGTFDVSWTGPGGFTSTAEDIAGLAPGVYRAVVTDQNLCSDSIDVEIIEPEEMLITGVVTDVECNGDMDGAIDITVTLGAGGYGYSWIGPGGFTSTSQDLSGIGGGTYVVTVTDVNLCEQTATFIVDQNEEIIIDASLTQISCAGEATGAIDITVIGGQGTFQYSWIGPDGYVNNIEDITGLEAGTYLIEVEDQVGCTETEAFVISEPMPISMVATVQDPLCFGDANGDIDIVISGGTPDHVITWVGPGGFNQSGVGIDIQDLEAGTYFLNITDQFDCQLDTSFTLIEPTDLDASLSITDPGCDMDNGSVSSMVSGGTVSSDYTYYWIDSVGDTIGTASDISGLGTGTYTFEVQDDNGCAVIIPFELSSDVGSISAMIQDVTCFGDMDGAIDLEVTGLTGTLDVSWVGPSFTSDQLDISGLAAGDYTVTIEDELGCDLIETYAIGEPEEIIVNGNVVNESCDGANDGSIDITVLEGQGDLTYAWSGPGGFTSASEDLTGLQPGSYTVLVTDTASCTGTATFQVMPAITYDINAVIDDVACSGEETGAIDILITPALPGADYSWVGPGLFSATTEDIVGLAPGQYIITVLTPQFCVIEDTFVVDEADPIMVDLMLTNSACGLDQGQAVATVTGGTIAVDYDYQFYTLPDGVVVSTTNTASSLAGGLYGYTVTDDNGCSAVGSFTISDEFGDLDAVIQGVTCIGSDDGSIDITVTGLTDPLVIQWTGPGGFTSSSEDISGLAPGLYTVSIEDDNGCVIGDTYEIEEGVGISITGILQHIDCAGEGDGAIDMSFSGGVMPYDIQWTGPGGFMSTSEDISGLEPGEYTVSITDGATCTGTESFTILEPDVLDVDAFVTPVSCNGETNGAIAINILGGTGPFIIQWTGPGGFMSSFEDISGLSAGFYTLDIEDAFGCIFNEVYLVNEPDAIVLDTLQLVNSSCDQAVGVIEVEASGGNSPYEYTWVNSGGFQVSTLPIADELAADTYTVTVEDEDGCTISQDFIISNQEAFLTAIVDSVSCNGLADGAIDLTVTGEITGMADTLWVGPNGFTATTEDISGLEAGVYTVSIEDEASCVFSESFTVFEPDTIVVLANIEAVTCNGDTDGSIDITVSGGIPPYDYSWTGPGSFTSSLEDISSLPPGIYQVTVVDQNDCTVQYDFEVTEPAPILISEENLADPTCQGLDDGLISIDVTGGNGGYGYSWTGPSFSSLQEDITGLAAGEYTVVVTDDSLCTGTASFTLEAPQVIAMTATSTDILCHGQGQGAIDVTASGGNGVLDFDWTGPSFTASTEDITGLEAGIYDLTITDDIGCQRDTSIVITEPDTMDVALDDIVHVACAGDTDGSISVTTSGGVSGYDHSWSGPNGFTAITEDIGGLEPGVYTLTVLDANLCSYSVDYEILSPDSILITSLIQGVTCNGDTDGSIDITPTGGTGVLDFQWTGPGVFTSSNEDISGLEPGIYEVTISDEIPCQAVYQLEVTEPEAILITADDLMDPTCSGLSDGSIDISVAGGNGGYDFQWTGPGFTSTLEDISGLAPGTYEIQVLDDSACVGMASFDLEDIQVMDIDIAVDSIACNGDADASIDITVTGGTGTLDYAWVGPVPFTSTNEDISGLEPGDYTLQVEDDQGCILDSIISILEPSVITLPLTEVTDVTCNGDDDGAITIDIEGGTPGYDIDWTGPSGFESDIEDISDLAAGNYLLTISDDNDCEYTESFEVIEPDAIAIAVDEIIPSECENSTDGSIAITPSGGTPDYDFDWVGPQGEFYTDEDLNGVLPGMYSLNLTDDQGCMISEAFTVPFLVAISVDAGDYPPTCDGEEIQLLGEAGPVGSSYGWSTPGGAQFSDLLDPVVPLSITNDVFVLTVVNGNCTATDTAYIDVLPNPVPNAGEDREVFLEDLVELGGDPTWVEGPAASYSWSPSADLSDPTAENPTWIATGEQLFTVAVIGANGCLGTDDVLITINPEIEVYSGFTPHNGDGRNETWDIGNVELFPEMIVKVYNRWGDELWISDAGYSTPWDGTYDGSPLPVGTYYYIIELNDERYPDPITGPITIFR